MPSARTPLTSADLVPAVSQPAAQIARASEMPDSDTGVSDRAASQSQVVPSRSPATATGFAAARTAAACAGAADSPAGLAHTGQTEACRLLPGDVDRPLGRLAVGTSHDQALAIGSEAQPRYDPLPGQMKSDFLGSAGAGGRITLPGRLNGEVDLGVPLLNGPNTLTNSSYFARFRIWNEF